MSFVETILPASWTDGAFGRKETFPFLIENYE